ncbi:hypothetical protein [Pseudomonas kitaguniensis]|uniref:hypothetical protein n=1 Tax=Pseudomonas kitaguniensis TaxID=2607908 RepID=UPI003B9E62CB
MRDNALGNLVQRKSRYHQAARLVSGFGGEYIGTHRAVVFERLVRIGQQCRNLLVQRLQQWLRRQCLGAAIVSQFHPALQGQIFWLQARLVRKHLQQLLTQEILEARLLIVQALHVAGFKSMLGDQRFLIGDIERLHQGRVLHCDRRYAGRRGHRNASGREGQGGRRRCGVLRFFIIAGDGCG